MSWFKKLLPSRVRTHNAEKKVVPKGVWAKCMDCNAIIYQAELERNLYVCVKCGHHMPIGARARLHAFLDQDSWQEIGIQVEPWDRLKFKDSKKYKDRLQAAQKATGEREALIVLKGKLKGLSIVAAAFDFKFIGGSMGAAVGEKFVQGANTALEQHIPFICFATSGGARMQEGLYSLLQMGKTSVMLAKLAQHGVPYIVVLTNPTTGGVSASLAMLGDIIVAEPKALIGFAGPRVIEQTVRETLPEGFQRSEFLLEHGAIDMIIDRREQRERLAKLLGKLTRQMPA